MSKFLKVVVNVILICAIVVAGGLLIPPFAGVTTVIVDELDMDTNLARGAVAYAVSVPKEEFKSGDKVLISEGASQYVYEITGMDGERFVLEDKLSTDGGTAERTLSNTARKVVLIVPYIGYVSMALRTSEGLIIVGLAVVFIIILFILAEIWKKEDDEDEEEPDGDEEEPNPEGEEEEPAPGRRQQKKAEKRARKEAKKLDAKAERKRNKKGKTEEDTAEQESTQQEEPEMPPERAAVADPEPEQDGKQEPGTMPEQDLFAETKDLFAANIADILQERSDSGVKNGDVNDAQTDETAVQTDETAAQADETAEQEKPQTKKLAMPVYTKKELLQKAQASGDEPKVIEDEYSGITLLDYSDIL